MNVAAPGYIPALTGVRFLAGLFVFLFHYKPLSSSGNPLFQQLNGIFNEMYTGVGLFFVLSGFLICYVYYTGAAIQKPFLKKYFIRRFARIFPIFFLITTGYFIYWAFNGMTDPKYIGVYLFNITLLKGLSQSMMFTGIFQSWSLTVEETFYFLAPIIFIVIKKFRVVFLQVPVIMGMGLVLVLLFNIFPFLNFFADVRFTAQATFFGRCFEFFLGIQLALIVLRRSSLQPGKFPIATSLGLIVIILVLALMNLIRIQFDVKHAMDANIGLLVNNLLFPIGVVVFFYGLIYERSWVQRFFASPPVELLGKSSYAFYLIHAGPIAEWVHSFSNINFVTFLVLQAMSIAIFFFIERPLYRWIIR